MSDNTSVTGHGPVKVVFLDRATIPRHMEIPALTHACDFISYDATTAEQVQQRIHGATVVITNKVPLSREVIASAKELKLIAVAATGTDVIDVAAAHECGVTVTNVRGYASHSVPEHTFGLILALRRSIFAYHQSVAAGRWEAAGQFSYFDFPIHELAGATLGVIGGGSLGRAVAKLGEAFGMRVLLSDRKGSSTTRPGRAPFQQVLKQSDVITLHLPLNVETRDLISSAEFAQMQRKPLLINTGRGGLVNEEALIEALDACQISGAGFDVATTEPPPSSHPLMQLLERPNFLLTPHVGWASEEAIQNMLRQLVSNIDAFLDGEARNVVWYNLALRG